MMLQQPAGGAGVGGGDHGVHPGGDAVEWIMGDAYLRTGRVVNVREIAGCG